MRTRYGISPWIDIFPRSRRPDHPRLRGELTSEVAIIGGGLTGCATAYACAVAGPQADPDRSRSHRAGKRGPRRGVAVAGARAVVQGRHRAPRPSHVAAHLRRLAARVPRRRCSHPAAPHPVWTGGCDYIEVASRDDGKVLRREYEAREAAGLDAQWILPANVRKATTLDAPGAIRLGASFTLDPYRACLGLAGRRKVAWRDLLRTISRLKGSCGRQASGDRARRRPRAGSNRHRVHRYRHERVQTIATSLQISRAVFRDD